MPKVILNLADDKMKYRLIRVLFSVFLFGNCAFPPSDVLAQKGMVKGTTLYMTGTVLDGGVYRNNRFIKFIEEEDTEVQVFHPADLVEYRFFDGDVYLTRTIDEGGVKTSYFLLAYTRGNANLLVLKTRKGFRYFSEKKNQLIELNDDEAFKTNLAQVLNQCPAFQSSVPLVKRTKSSLSRAFYLHNRCYNGAFPRLRVGFSVGYAATIFEVQDLLYNYVPMRSLSPFFAVFVDTPLGLNPNWFANLQIQYQKTTYRNPPQSNNATSNFQLSTTSYSFPVLLKYKSTGKKFRTYALAGPSISIYTQRQSNLLEFISTSVNTQVYVRPMENVTQFQVNATAGLGTEYSFNLKNSLGLELRYSAGSGIRSEYNQRVSSWQLIGSVFF